LLLFSRCHSSRFVMRSHGLSRVITRHHEFSLFPFFSRISMLLTFYHTWARFLTVGHARSPFGTLLYSLLSLFSARSYVVAFSHCHALLPFVTRSHALSRIMNIHSWPFFSRLSLLLMFHHTWSLFLTFGHAWPLFVPLLY